MDYIDPQQPIDLAKFDRLFELHRATKLVEIAKDFNSKCESDQVIPLDFYADKLIGEDVSKGQYGLPVAEELIFLLWSRNAKLPVELTFDEPYDSNFIRLMEDVFIGCDDTVDYENLVFDDLWIPLFFKYYDKLPILLYSTLELDPFFTGSKERLEVFNDIWLTLSVSQNKPIKDYKELQKYIKDDKLSKLDIIYLLARLDDKCWKSHITPYSMLKRVFKFYRLKEDSS